jgi:hypothetical protein
VQGAITNHLRTKCMNAMRGGIILVIAVVLADNGCVLKALPPGEALSQQERRDAIRRASVWSPTQISSVDFRTGPKVEGAFAPNQWVTCDYKEKEMNGQSPKFTCETSPGDELKVKYGASNAEIFGEVLATRLFWGIGFPADRMFPVRVRCRGCSADPKHDPKRSNGTQEFDPAVVERKLPGRPMETAEDSGWKWSELDDIGPESPKGARAQRDALKLLAAFVQHSDSKPMNQRILCPEGQEIRRTGCRAPVLMIQDLGLTFGEATLINKNKNAVSVVAWSEVPVWKDPATCVARLDGAFNGTLENPQISEAGRAFLAGLLVQLTDAQLRDLFEVARVTRRSTDPGDNPDGPRASVREWVKDFKLKRAQIVDHHCPQ